MSSAVAFSEQETCILARRSGRHRRPGSHRLAATTGQLAQIGRYEVLGRLGAGGMGRVFRARDRELKRDVAIKVIKLCGDDRRTQSLRRRFRREGRALARLDHPSIVKVLEVGEHDGLPYLVMELIAGESLAERIDRSGPLPQVEAASIARKLALALEHAHQARVLHRDVKPANIQLRPNGDPLLVDFGLARTDDPVQLTVRGALVGTPGFASPEQMRGDLERIGGRSDIYGLGATLYAMLTGRAPDYDEWLPPGLLRLDLDPDLEAICLSCIRPDPLERYGSARELANDLARFSLAQGAPSLVEVVDTLEQSGSALSFDELMSSDSFRAALGVEPEEDEPVGVGLHGWVVTALLAAVTFALAITWVELDRTQAARQQDRQRMQRLEGEADALRSLQEHPDARVRAAAHRAHRQASGNR